MVKKLPTGNMVFKTKIPSAAGLKKKREEMGLDVEPDDWDKLYNG